MCGSRPIYARRLAALPLAFLLIVSAIEVRADDIRIGGTGAALGTMRLLLGAYTKSHPAVSGKVLPSLGSSGGIKAVMGGAIDLAVAARPLKEKERAAGATETKYATTALVPVVSASNSITGISTSELLALYWRKTGTWADGTHVRLVLRPKSESDMHVLTKYIPGIEGALEHLRSIPAIPVAYTDQENADAIEKMPGSFGIVALSLVLGEARDLKVLALDGVVANAATIADGSYPLRKSFYLVTGDKPGPRVRGFIAFVRSAEGRALLRQTGHAPEQE